MKRTSLESARCPIARSLDVIGDWWSLLIIRDAVLGKRRFGEFQKSLGPAKNILAARLRTLVGHGILEMAPASDGSAYQEYVLTEKGRGLFHVLVALRQWGDTYCFEPGASPRSWWTGSAAGPCGGWSCARRMGGCWGRTTPRCVGSTELLPQGPWGRIEP
ncbi:winged helix-turn-helix transcriptional regulator [Cystobacter fuscus]